MNLLFPLGSHPKLSREFSVSSQLVPVQNLKHLVSGTLNKGYSVWRRECVRMCTCEYGTQYFPS